MEFKTKRAAERFSKIHHQMIQIACEMDLFCAENHQDFVITETFTTKEEDDLLKRVSSSHREGRAIDIRTRNWSDDFLKTFIQRFTEIYNDFGAIGGISKKPSLIIDKSKTKSPHLHVQLNRNFSIKE